MKNIIEFIKKRKENITKSVRVKLFFIMTTTIMSIILLLIFVNSFIIESYYLHYKKETLLSSYEKLNKYLYSNMSTSAIELEIEKIAINNNFNILITNNRSISIYNSSKDFKQYMLNLDIVNKKDVLYNEDNVVIIESRDYSSGINFLMLIGKMDNGYTSYIRMPISSIKDSVKISNNFLYSIGLITVIISGIAMLVISKKFTRPISELSGIANKMSNLDFSQKYRIKDNS